MGLQGMINDLVERSDYPTGKSIVNGQLSMDNYLGIAQTISGAENYYEEHKGTFEEINKKASTSKAPVLGITGTGGSGKSSMVDEIVRRFLIDFKDKKLGIVSRSEEHTSELQSQSNLVCRLLLE